jgi:hypothetical protein
MQAIRSKFSLVALLLIAGACAAPAPRAEAAPLGARGQRHEVELLIDGAPAPQFFHGGESYVLGQRGARYTLRVWNRSYARVEAVVSVDGLDVVDGQPADYREKRGYVITPGGFVDIDGWRLSGQQAAAFRFGSVRDSYAARTSGARNVGVIGVALFPERPAPVAWPVYPSPRPWPRPPRDRWMGEDAQANGRAKRSAEAQESASADAPARAEPAPPSSFSSGGSGSRQAEAPAPRSAAAADDGMRAPRRRLGLGTEFGEAVESQVEQVSFVRANRTTPAVVLGLRYNDRAGLLAIGIDVDGVGRDMLSEEAIRRSADPFPVSARGYASPPPGWRR